MHTYSRKSVNGFVCVTLIYPYLVSRLYVELSRRGRTFAGTWRVGEPHNRVLLVQPYARELDK
jgi:hypothetical protein